jgi:hypothetical protein
MAARPSSEATSPLRAQLERQLQAVVGMLDEGHRRTTMALNPFALAEGFLGDGARRATSLTPSLED